MVCSKKLTFIPHALHYMRNYAQFIVGMLNKSCKNNPHRALCSWAEKNKWVVTSSQPLQFFHNISGIQWFCLQVRFPVYSFQCYSFPRELSFHSFIQQGVSALVLRFYFRWNRFCYNAFVVVGANCVLPVMNHTAFPVIWCSWFTYFFAHLYLVFCSHKPKWPKL